MKYTILTFFAFLFCFQLHSQVMIEKKWLCIEYVDLKNFAEQVYYLQL